MLQAYRGLGIGQRLMQQAQHWSLEQNIDELELQVWESNRRAIAFYEQLGYSDDSENHEASTDNPNVG